MPLWPEAAFPDRLEEGARLGKIGALAGVDDLEHRVGVAYGVDWECLGDGDQADCRGIAAGSPGRRVNTRAHVGEPIRN